MIKRRTSLQSHTELQRKTPLRRTGWLPVKPRKATLKRGPGRKSAEEKRGREAVEARGGGVCEIQVPGVCLGAAEVFSHRKRKSQSSKAEKWSPTNGLAGCGSGTTGCEGHLTARGSTADVRSKGWTVHPSLNPSAVPVLRRGVYVWLYEDGSLTECDLAEIAAWIGAVA